MCGGDKVVVVVVVSVVAAVVYVVERGIKAIEVERGPPPCLFRNHTPFKAYVKAYVKTLKEVKI